MKKVNPSGTESFSILVTKLKESEDNLVEAKKEKDQIKVSLSSLELQKNGEILKLQNMMEDILSRVEQAEMNHARSQVAKVEVKRQLAVSQKTLRESRIKTLVLECELELIKNDPKFEEQEKDEIKSNNKPIDTNILPKQQKKDGVERSKVEEAIESQVETIKEKRKSPHRKVNPPPVVIDFEEDDEEEESGIQNKGADGTKKKRRSKPRYSTKSRNSTDSFAVFDMTKRANAPKLKSKS